MPIQKPKTAQSIKRTGVGLPLKRIKRDNSTRYSTFTIKNLELLGQNEALKPSVKVLEVKQVECPKNID